MVKSGTASEFINLELVEVLQKTVVPDELKYPFSNAYTFSAEAQEYLKLDKNKFMRKLSMVVLLFPRQKLPKQSKGLPVGSVGLSLYWKSQT